MKKNVVGFFKDNKLLTGLYFVFVFLLCTTTYVGFSGNVEGNAVKVSSITPEYDEASSVVVNNNDVVFNDKNQEVKYKVVLENTQGTDLYVSALNQTTPSESFLSYKVENLKKDDAIKGNSKKEVIVSLKTNAIEGWGRNFDDELTANVSFAKKVVSNNQNVGSPDTGDGVVLAVLIAVTSATGLAILIVSKNKFAKYLVFVIMLTPALTLVKADTTLEIPITLNVSFESQNVMKPAKNESDAWNDYWEYRSQIKNVYIQNEITAMPGELVEKFDVSNDGNERVWAYLVENAEESSNFDLYLQADGVIYPNTNSSYYFYNMHRLDSINGIDGLDTSKVTNMKNMFYGVGGSSQNFTLDLGENFDTSSVTDMSFMFDTCGFMNTNFTLDLGDKFDTSKVTTMHNMFAGTGTESSVFTLDLGDKFDTSNVTDMSGMFEAIGCKNSNFTLSLGDKFDTSNVISMSRMFYQTGDNSEVFNLNLGDKFDTSNVTDMDSMFYGAGLNSTKLNFSITIRNPNINMYNYAFYGAATKEGTKITVNYTSGTEELVDRMIATKDAVSNVVKGHLIVDVDSLAVGDEIHISGEKFNVISQDDDTVTMLAKYNLGTNYRQSITANYVTFSDNIGWEYTPGAIDLDIQKWSTFPKEYINNYVEYLNGIVGVIDIVGNLITMKQIKDLECDLSDDYSRVLSNACDKSSFKNWLLNGQMWFTSSVYPGNGEVWYISSSLGHAPIHVPFSIRPTITISKETLKNLGK